MNNSIYKLVYCSRNQIRGQPLELTGAVEKILLSARTNNARAGVTGALLFNEGLFAQVLEGPLAEVERIFEKIQLDPRHSDVTILQSGTAAARDFPEWSMAFAASDEASILEFATPVFERAFLNPSQGGGEVLNLLHELVIQEDWMMAG